MFISDLSYLETTVSSDVTGSSRRRRHGGGRRGGLLIIDVDVAIAKGSTKASAFAIKGNAIAVAKTTVIAKA